MSEYLVCSDTITQSMQNHNAEMSNAKHLYRMKIDKMLQRKNSLVFDKSWSITKRDGSKSVIMIVLASKQVGRYRAATSNSKGQKEK